MAYTTIDKPSDYFNTVTYVANQTDDRQITVGFQPDFTWLKDRDQAVNHDLYDAVRGATKYLSSNKTNAEGTQTDGLKSFNSTGFTLGTGWGNQTTGDDYVSWNWLASNTTASNTDGTITSTVSANQTAGFSIGTYNGSGSDNTVGHGLGVAPDMIFVKCKSTAHDWVVYHSALGNAKILTLNATTAAQSATGWQSTSPTSTVFSIDNAANSLNQSGQSFVFYAFASKKGYSKFGSYTGNGSATDGTFVYTGFKPAFVMIKCSSESGSYTSWSMFDTTRQTFNVNAGKTLYANKSSAEGVRGNGSDSSTTIPAIDMLSNGFKCRVLNDEVNNTATYIYMAFAENPFTTSTGIPCTAR